MDCAGGAAAPFPRGGAARRLDAARSSSPSASRRDESADWRAKAKAAGVPLSALIRSAMARTRTWTVPADEVEVVVEPVNDAPEAAADSARTPEDTKVVIDVLANDSDVEGDAMGIESGLGTVTRDGTARACPSRR